MYICVASYLRAEGLALRGGRVGVGRDGRAGVDVICVDVVADAAAHGAAVIPAETHTQQAEHRETLILLEQ